MPNSQQPFLSIAYDKTAGHELFFLTKEIAEALTTKIGEERAQEWQSALLSAFLESDLTLTNLLYNETAPLDYGRYAFLRERLLEMKRLLKDDDGQVVCPSSRTR